MFKIKSDKSKMNSNAIVIMNCLSCKIINKLKINDKNLVEIVEKILSNVYVEIHSWIWDIIFFSIFIHVRVKISSIVYSRTIVMQMNKTHQQVHNLAKHTCWQLICIDSSSCLIFRRWFSIFETSKKSRSSRVKHEVFYKE